MVHSVVGVQWIGLDPSFSGFVIAGGEAGGERHVHVAAAGRTHSVDYISSHLQLFLPSYGEFCLPIARFCSAHYCSCKAKSSPGFAGK